MIDDQIIRLHSQGFATGAIAIRLGVDSSAVRRVVRTHLKAVAEASKPHYNGISAEEKKRRQKVEAKVARAQAAVQKAERQLRELDAH